MKNVVTLFLCIFISNCLYAQYDESDLSSFKTVAKLPQNYSTASDLPLFSRITVNGYDNYYLGVDFGEPHIATNPTDPLNSICAFNINNVYVTQNGIDWGRVTVPFPGFSVIGDPVLSFDSLGNAYYVQLYQNGTVYGIVVAKSTNKGLNWTGIYNVENTTVGLSDKEWIAADRSAGPYSNNLYIGWRQFGSTGMRFVRSTNSGVNWSSPMTFSGGQGAYVAVGANGGTSGGSVYFAASGNSNILVTRSSDGGQTFGPQVDATGSFTGSGIVCSGRQTVKGCIRTNSFPKMDADNSFASTRGNVYVVYEANPAGADVADVYMVKSTNNGQNWTTPLRINDDATTADQWLPAISVDTKTGKVFVTWYDSREDPVNNKRTKIYATVSTDGGATFAPNSPISNADFDPDSMKVSQGSGEANYIGDYFGVSAIENTSYIVWMDGRNRNLGSYVGFYPDYAMTAEENVYLGSNNNVNTTVKVPGVKGPFNERIKFTATVDTMPPSGNISVSFINNKDSINTIPDSVQVKITTSGNATPGRYKVSITGRGKNGTPVHRRTINVYVSASLVSVNTNRGSLVSYKVNGVSYTGYREFIFPNGSSVSLEAPDSSISGSNKYVFTNWSDGGASSHNITVTGELSLLAAYKIQYKVLVISNPPSSYIFGNTFQDSAVNFKFGLSYNRIIISADSTYWFRGWNGGGIGSYTSPDSVGLDDTVQLSIKNPIVETIRWSLNNPSPIGITQINSEIPQKFELYQNYPNPFNPVTRIKFDLPKATMVKIIVYDILGKEVEILADEFKEAGKYQVSFDASALSSSIYYYKIITDNNSSVKKMLLIK